MFKALLKTRLHAYSAGMFRSKKKKTLSKGAMVGYGVLGVYIAVCFFGLFFMMASQLCGPLVEAGMGWLYFALMGTMATAMGVVGSVFTAQAQLYEAKDNEMLLAMPIPPSYILGSRMIALYGQNLLFEIMVLAPTLVAYFLVADVSVIMWLMAIVVALLLPVFALTLSCILGWLVALISSKMRNKSLVTLVLWVLFMGGYFYLYSKMGTYLQMLVMNTEAVSQTVRTVLFPLYQMGLAAMGDPLALLWFFLCVAIPFGVTYAILSRSFISIATTKRGAAKLRYREQTLSVSKPTKALLKKELRHLLGSPMYLLNGALGSVFLILGAGFLLIKQSMVLEYFAGMPASLMELLPALGCVAISTVAAMNLISAPSISLEAKTLWLMQSLPVTPWQVIRSKALLHTVLTAPAAMVCGAAMAVALKTNVVMTLMLILLPAVYSWLCGLFGLILNLKFPRMDWTSEAQAVKQSMSCVLAMFGGWALVLLPVGGFFLVRSALTVEVYSVICLVVLVGVCLLMRRWLKNRGSTILENL